MKSIKVHLTLKYSLIAITAEHHLAGHRPDEDVVDVHEWLIDGCTCVFMVLCSCCLCVHHAQEKKNLVTKSITLTFQGVSLSCYKWLPERLACQGWEISHTVACKHLSVNCHGSVSSIFIWLAGISNATKHENPLGNQHCRRSVKWSWVSLTEIYE